VKVVNTMVVARFKTVTVC